MRPTNVGSVVARDPLLANLLGGVTVGVRFGLNTPRDVVCSRYQWLAQLTLLQWDAVRRVNEEVDLPCPRSVPGIKQQLNAERGPCQSKPIQKL